MTDLHACKNEPKQTEVPEWLFVALLLKFGRIKQWISGSKTWDLVWRFMYDQAPDLFLLDEYPIWYPNPQTPDQMKHNHDMLLLTQVYDRFMYWEDQDESEPTNKGSRSEFCRMAYKE